MISPKYLVECLATYGMDYYVGVPDSLLKDFCAYIDDHGAKDKHTIVNST